MEIGDRYHAQLRVSHHGETKADLLFDFHFSWANLVWSSAKAPVSKTKVDHIAAILRGADGIRDEEQLRDLGGRVKGAIPQQITGGLSEFDDFAKKLLSYSGSRLTLTIVTDSLLIPWEIALTSDNETCWCERYLVGRELEPFVHERKLGERTRAEILLLMNTFDKQRLLKLEKPVDEKRLREWISRESRLREFVEEVNTKHPDSVAVRLCEYPVSISEVEEQLRGERGKYDVILYVGSYLRNEKSDEEGLAFEDPNNKWIEIIRYDTIHPSKHTRPLIFFDACQTNISCLMDGNSEASASLPRVIEHLLDTPGSSFIGTVQDIEAVTAVSFAHHFLASLCDEGASLSQAVHDARERVREEFDESEELEEGDNEYRKVQASSFVLLGDSHSRLHASFLHRGKRIRLVWPAALAPYCERFGIDIYPPGFDKVDRVPADDFVDLRQKFEEMQAEMRDNPDLIGIADMPIPYALEIIGDSTEENQGEQWVVVNSAFRPLPGSEEAALFHIGDLKDVVEVFTEEYATQATILSYVCVSYKLDGELPQWLCQRMNYRDILDRIRRAIDQEISRPEAYVLVGKYKIEFESFLSQLETRGHVEQLPIGRIPLHETFLEVLDCEEWEKYQAEYVIPTSVLVARRDHAVRYRRLFEQLFTSWYEWVKLSFRVENERLLQYQEPLFALGDTCIDAIIKFSEFIHVELNNKVYGKEMRISRPLRESDFVPIAPRQRGYGDALYWQHEKLVGLANEADERVNEAERMVKVWQENMKELKGAKRIALGKRKESAMTRLGSVKEDLEGLRKQWQDGTCKDPGKLEEEYRVCLGKIKEILGPED